MNRVAAVKLSASSGKLVHALFCKAASLADVEADAVPGFEAGDGEGVSAQPGFGEVCAGGVADGAEFAEIFSGVG